MKIAVNTIRLLKTEEENVFAIKYFEELAYSQSDHQFIFIEQSLTEKNNPSILIKKKFSSSILWQFWNNYTLPALLGKNKIDVLMNANGFFSQRVKIPQCVLISSLAFLYYPEFLSKAELKLNEKMLRQPVQKNQIFLTTSLSAKDEIIKRYSIHEDKIDVVNGYPDEIYKPAEQKEKELIKEKYTNGKEFFLYIGPDSAINSLVNLLKAFSLFKKRQKSNMQLVICITATTNYSFQESLKTYKYRTDIKLITGLTEKEQSVIMAAAYAFISPAYYKSSGLMLMQAMQCGVPVITSQTGVAMETCADAALYADPGIIEIFAEKMMLLFKDEKKRNELILLGKNHVQQFSQNKTLKALWHAIQKTVEP